MSNSFSPSVFLILQERNRHHADMDKSKREKSSFFSRYHQTLQNLKPFRCSSSKLVSSMTYCFCFHTGVLMFDVPMSSSHPLDSASFLSFTTFAWMTPMMWRMFKNRQDDENLHLSPHDAAETSSERSDSIGVSRFTLGKGFLSVNLTHVRYFAGSTDSGRKKWQRWARRMPLWFE